MNLIKSIVSLLDVSSIKLKKNKKDEKPSLVKDVVKDPDSFLLEAYVEDGEIVIKVKKRKNTV